jgi:glutathione peroxidase
MKITLASVGVIGLVVGVAFAISTVRTVMGKSVVGQPSQPKPMSSDSTTQPADSVGVLSFKVDTIEGQPFDMALLKGKVVLIVNTASKCGFTKQLAGLEALNKKYADQGLVVVGFPSNDFGGQDPGSNAEIASFCEKNYGVTFPMMSKIAVKGDAKHPLYQFLTEEKTNGQFAGEIGWNFTKFLVDRNGKVFARFGSNVAPDAEQLVKAVEAGLKS